MDWNIDFISYKDFKNHVKNTIAQYGVKIKPYDLKEFNRNIVDPVKMVFDKALYRSDWETIIANEIFRQREKAQTNEIGYFHQRLFEFVNGCRVPDNGKEGGWDVIYRNPDGIRIDDRNTVHNVYVEMKNKHNTMNSSASGKTYMKMQNQLLKDDDCACFLVEAIAKKSQNIEWKTTVDKQHLHHARIRRVSIDKFYEMVTGDPNAFYKICMALPKVVEEVLEEEDSFATSTEDTVYEKLSQQANNLNISDDMSMYLAMYLLGFSTYNGFDQFNTLQNIS